MYSTFSLHNFIPKFDGILWTLIPALISLSNYDIIFHYTKDCRDSCGQFYNGRNFTMVYTVGEMAKLLKERSCKGADCWLRSAPFLLLLQIFFSVIYFQIPVTFPLPHLYYKWRYLKGNIKCWRFTETTAKGVLMRQPVQQLIDRYQNSLYAAAFNTCQNQMDAEDVVQETFVLV